MENFDHKHYVPLLRARQGEFAALNELGAPSRAVMTPLFDIPAAQWDFDTDAPARPMEQHLPGFVEKIRKSWGDSLCFVDLLELDGETMPGGVHPVTYLFQEFSPLGMLSIPVVGIQRSSAYLNAVRDVIRRDKRGVCIRVDNNDLENPGTLSNGLNDLATYLDLKREQCDLIFDLKTLSPETRGPMVFAMNTILSLLPGIDKWRTLTLAGSSFPDSMMDVPQHTFHQLPRVEWEIWTAIVTRGGVPRLPTYGDYGVSSPSASGEGIDPRMMRMSANLRYTLDNTWLLLKGRNVRDHGFEQFRDLCRLLVGSQHFKGQDFSWGDNYIHEAAQNAAGPGNASTWRKVGTSHHLALVKHQISTLFG